MAFVDTGIKIMLKILYSGYGIGKLRICIPYYKFFTTPQPKQVSSELIFPVYS